MRKLLLLIVALFVAGPALAADCTGPAAICAKGGKASLQLIRDGKTVPIQYDSNDLPGVREAVDGLGGDFQKLAGDTTESGSTVIIAGTLGHNAVIDDLAADKRIDVGAIRGKWEAYLQIVVDNPWPGVSRALVIVGSDRRGTIFGIYDLSRRMGVSPWTWWADVPVRKVKDLWINPGARIEMPKVKYRGIFLNDEEPALGGWARATFGGVNNQFYERVFELMLRLRANYIWPAMWGKSLWDDDPESAALASRMGIVLGTSHHEPLLRAHVEWQRHGNGPWDYTKNAEVLRDFWRQGMVRNAGREAIVTVGMRGDGDEPMTRETATGLLETIVADQRRIIEEVTGKPAAETPQMWALYKEVQDYYDKGMRVPDDVTLLFCDDNWGNIRRLPRPGETRAGGYGVYYHFDYVGGPRNYKWLNTNQIARVWEQMSLAQAHGANRVWIVNVGDLKPMELPTSFFLDMAWNPEAMSLDAMADYHRAWAGEQFGPDWAAPIGDIMDRTTRMLARRKPELISPETWNLGGEAGRVLADYERLEKDATFIALKLPAEMKDAYFQLVLHPVLAAANLHRLYVTVAENRSTSDPYRLDVTAFEAKRLFGRDAELSRQYEATGGGRWIHMMSQTHIGYTSWQQPERDIMPEVRPGDGSGRDHNPHPDTGPSLVWPRPKPPVQTGPFAETGGFIAIEAEHHARATPGAGAKWITIPGLGRTLSAVTPWPQIAPSAAPGEGARLEYDIWLDTPGELRLSVVASPSLDVTGARGLRYAIAIDDGPPQIVDLWAGTTDADWNRAVADSVRVTISRHRVAAPRRHTVKLWMIDPGVVIQRLVIDRGTPSRDYLGPPESPRRN